MSESTGLHRGHRERLKQQFYTSGADGLNDHQLLELLLFYCIPQRDTNVLAHRLLNKYGSLENVFGAGVDALSSEKGLGFHSAVMLSAIGAAAQKTSQRRHDGAPITSPKAAMAYCLDLIADKNREYAYVISLNKQMKPIYAERVGEGSVTSVSMHPRMVLASTIRHKASSVLLLHNHPSGDLMPSNDDLELTDTLVRALASIEIPVIDHIIVGTDNAYSMFSCTCLYGSCTWQDKLDRKLPALSMQDIKKQAADTHVQTPKRS